MCVCVWLGGGEGYTACPLHAHIIIGDKLCVEGTTQFVTYSRLPCISTSALAV